MGGQENFADSVMGRAAMLVTGGFLAFCATLQLLGVSASRALDSISGRSQVVDGAWSLLLIVSFLLIVCATVADTRPGMDDVAMVFETIGACMLMVGVAVYAAAVLKATGFPGNLIVLGLCFSTIINVGGRQVFLHRRAKEVYASAQEVKAREDGGDE